MQGRQGVSMNAQHSSASNEHYTPVDVLEAARNVMGGFDLDPCTTHACNVDRVKAGACYTKENNGLALTWFGRVWCNPPGGLINRKSSAAVWWGKAVEEWMTNRVHSVMFLGFSIELLATSQDSPISVAQTAFCVPRKRLAYDKPEGGGYVTGFSPTHSNVIAYLPPWERTECGQAIQRFVEHFSPFGNVRV